MIAETANLATGRNVVKQAEGSGGILISRRLEYQLQLGSFTPAKSPTKVGFLKTIYQGKDTPQDRNANEAVCHQMSVEAMAMIWWEQTKTGRCLSGRLSGKPLRTAAFELPAQMGAEGGAE
jgi:hypothetical protein